MGDRAKRSSEVAGLSLPDTLDEVTYALAASTVANKGPASNANEKATAEPGEKDATVHQAANTETPALYLSQPNQKDEATGDSTTDAAALVIGSTSATPTDSQHAIAAASAPEDSGPQSSMLLVDAEALLDVSSNPSHPSGNSKPAGCIDLFVGGMGADTTEADVYSAFSPLGSKLLSVYLAHTKQPRKCKGYGFVRVADTAAADEACTLVTQIGGKRVGIHVSRSRPSLEHGTHESIPPDGKSPSSLNRLFNILRNRPNKQEAVAQALDMVLCHQPRIQGAMLPVPWTLHPAHGAPSIMHPGMVTVPLSISVPVGVMGSKRSAAVAGHVPGLAVQHPKKKQPKGASSLASDHATAQPPQQSSSTAAAASAQAKPSASVPDMDKYLDAYPACKSLLDDFRSNPKAGNKTPAAVLNEYVFRKGWEVKYDEDADTPLGPFTIKATVIVPGTHQTIAEASGRGKTKKDARQVAGAATVEALLKTGIAASEFLNSKAAARPAYPRAGLGHPQRNSGTDFQRPVRFRPAGPGGHVPGESNRVTYQAPLRERILQNMPRQSGYQQQAEHNHQSQQYPHNQQQQPLQFAKHRSAGYQQQQDQAYPRQQYVNQPQQHHPSPQHQATGYGRAYPAYTDYQQPAGPSMYYNQPAPHIRDASTPTDMRSGVVTAEQFSNNGLPQMPGPANNVGFQAGYREHPHQLPSPGAGPAGFPEQQPQMSNYGGYGYEAGQKRNYDAAMQFQGLAVSGYGSNAMQNQLSAPQAQALPQGMQQGYGTPGAYAMLQPQHAYAQHPAQLQPQQAPQQAYYGAY